MFRVVMSIIELVLVYFDGQIIFDDSENFKKYAGGFKLQVNGS